MFQPAVQKRLARLNPLPIKASRVSSRSIHACRNDHLPTMGEHFRRSPAFSVPESAQRWANQVRQEGEIEA
nr:hypothetical protein [Klebsiella pneumoniae]